MNDLEQLAVAALRRDSLTLRALTMDFLESHSSFAHVAKPESNDLKVIAISASLVELFASRAHQRPPAWTNSIPASPEPVYLVSNTERMPRLRELCLNESPEPLRKRGFYAPPNFLTFA